MKKVLLFLCSIAIATTACTQIKANRAITKSFEPAKQNTAILAAVNANTDSVELNQLFEAYKIADADATNKLEKLLEKMKTVHAKSAELLDANTKNERELAMVRMQSLVSQRGTMLQMITSMMSALNDSYKSIIKNIGR